MGKKKKKKKKKRAEEAAQPIEPADAPTVEAQSSPPAEETSGLQERPTSEPEPEAAPEAPVPPPGEDQLLVEEAGTEASAVPESEEPGAADRPPEDVPDTSGRPGLFARLTGWLGGGSEPAATEAEPEPDSPPDSVEVVAPPADVEEDAGASLEEAVAPSAAEQPQPKSQQVNELEKLRGEKAAAESRVQALEAKLAGQEQSSSELQKQVEELTRRLDAKDAELNSLRSQSQETEQAREEGRRALSRLRDMEAALKQAEEKARELQTELRAQEVLLDRLEEEKERGAAAAPTRQSGPDFSSEKAAELYRQAVTPLTVLVASADLLVMDPGLDPSLRETASEMKTQSQALLELIRKYAGPGT